MTPTKTIELTTVSVTLLGLLFCSACSRIDGCSCGFVSSCVSCEVLDASSGTLQYSGDDVRRMASGHWEGAYVADDAFGPFALTVDVAFESEEALEMGPSAHRLSPPDCYEPDGGDDPEYCVALSLRARVIATSDTNTLPNLPDGQADWVRTAGWTLQCDLPSGESPKGCPSIGVSDVRNGADAVIVFGSTEQLWVALPDSRSRLHYTMIGRRTSGGDGG